MATCVVYEQPSDFVFVSRDEIDASCSRVVALTDEDSSEASLEARVKAVNAVARVHELSVAAERRSFGCEDDAGRINELESALTAESGESAVEEAGWLFGDSRTAEEVREYIAEHGTGEEEARVATRVGCRALQAQVSKKKKDDTERQSRRDIERDCLVLDGESSLEGAVVGYEAVVEALVVRERRLLERAETEEWRTVDDGDLRAFAKLALRAVNRTESGGMGLDAIHAALRPPGGEGLLVAVPDSRGAEPLRIALSLKPMLRGTQWRWGLRAAVEGSTAYRLFANDDFEKQQARARATYTNALLLPLDGLSSARQDDDLNTIIYDKSAASVEVEFYAPVVRIEPDNEYHFTTEPTA